MITYNLTNTIVNGTLGVVTHATDQHVTVALKDGRVVPVERVVFKTYNPDSNNVLASRKQLPIRVAYALTFHKCQGYESAFTMLTCVVAYFVLPVHVQAMYVRVFFRC